MEERYEIKIISGGEEVVNIVYGNGKYIKNCLTINLDKRPKEPSLESINEWKKRGLSEESRNELTRINLDLYRKTQELVILVVSSEEISPAEIQIKSWELIQLNKLYDLEWAKVYNEIKPGIEIIGEALQERIINSFNY